MKKRKLKTWIENLEYNLNHWKMQASVVGVSSIKANKKVRRLKKKIAKLQRRNQLLDYDVKQFENQILIRDMICSPEKTAELQATVDRLEQENAELRAEAQRLQNDLAAFKASLFVIRS